MKLVMYSNINDYMGNVMDILAENEIQNNILISNCLRGRDGMDTTNWFMATIKDENGALKLIALMTPPHNLVIYEPGNTPNNDAENCLINELTGMKLEIPGLLSEKALADRFSFKYSSASGKPVKDGMKMRIYKLDKVNDIPETNGRLRPAEEKDLHFLPYWNIAFASDCGINAIDVSSAAEKVKRLIHEKNLYIWEDNIPVSQAAMGRRTPNGAIVNAVYTPPFYRSKGYATSCVAGLSRHLLESGYEFCSLFTDLANPISNSIYMKIGYVPVCDYNEYRFE